MEPTAGTHLFLRRQPDGNRVARVSMLQYVAAQSAATLFALFVQCRSIGRGCHREEVQASFRETCQRLIGVPFFIQRFL